MRVLTLTDLPIELQEYIFSFCDVDTCVKNGYYKGLEKKTTVNLLNFSLIHNYKEYYRYLRNKGYKFNELSLQYAIYTNDIHIVEEVLNEASNGDSLKFDKLFYLYCAEFNYLNEMKEYLEQRLK